VRRDPVVFVNSQEYPRSYNLRADWKLKQAVYSFAYKRSQIEGLH